MFQQILHPLFWLLSDFPARLLSHFPSLYLSQHFPVDFARFPLIVIMFSCSFYIIYILFVGFQSIHAFLIYFSKIFTRLLFAPFPLVCCIFNVFFQEFYPSPSFSDRLLSHFPALSLSFSSMLTASSWFAPSIRSGFLHVPRDFPWFVPSIRSVFVRFPGDFVRFPLIVIMFSCSFIVFSNTSSWPLRPPKRRT